MTSAFTSLSATVLEDTMELSSSPAGNQFDGDIDIDLSDYPAGVGLTDDERMMDDGEPMRPATATDEMMDDDDHTVTAPVNEQMMHDDPGNFLPDLADEELIDYDDQDYQEHTDLPIDETTQADDFSGLPAPAETQVTEEPVDEETVRNSEEASLEEAKIRLNEQAIAESVSQTGVTASSQAAEALLEATQEPDTTEPEQLTDAVTEAPPVEVHETEESGEATQADEEADADEADHDETEITKAPPQLSGTLDTNLSHVSEGPPTPTDTGLHPMTLRFADHEMPLFKSRAQPNGLLKDDNLASVSLADLIYGCRQRLSTKLGVSIPDDQDLVLNFDRLGMMLFEGSRSASSTSLDDVVDVYLTLHQNDSVTDVPPLLLSLNPQPFSSMFDGFKTAAAEGTGMSHFLQSSEEEHSADHGETENAVHEEGDYPEEGYEGDEQHESYDENGTENYEIDLGEEQDGNQAQYDEYNEEAEREYEEDENAQENYEDQSAFQHEKYPGPEDDLSQYDDEEYREEDASAEQSHPDQPAEHEESSEVVQPKSTANSDSIRGDPANDNADAYTGEGEDDFLDFFNEGDDTDAQDASAQTTNPDQQASAKRESVSEAHTDQATVGTKSANASNEVSNDAEDGDDLTASLQQEYDEDGENILEFIEDDDAVQTDNLDQTYEDFDQNEESEQFHTAFDLLDDTEDANDDNNAAEYAGEATNGEEYPAEDDIGFDDDDDGENDHDTTGAAVGGSNSPLGKRSFEEHAEEDYIDFDEPELKKAKSG